MWLPRGPAWATKTQADTYYAPLTGSTAYAGASHTHTGVYQPVGNYLVAADIAGKANTTDVTAALAGKSDTTHTHTGVYQPVGNYLTDGTVYQTKANMTVVGSETTYYSGAKVDQLLSGLGGGASPITHLSAKW